MNVPSCKIQFYLWIVYVYGRSQGRYAPLLVGYPEVRENKHSVVCPKNRELHSCGHGWQPTAIRNPRYNLARLSFIKSPVPHMLRGDRLS